MASQEHRPAGRCLKCPDKICVITSIERRIIDLSEISWYGGKVEPFRARVRECKDMVIDPPVSDSA